MKKAKLVCIEELFTEICCNNDKNFLISCSSPTKACKVIIIRRTSEIYSGLPNAL